MKKTVDDNSYAKISEESVEIFGQMFPLERPYYYESGELESFAIEPTIINYRDRLIPIGGRIWLRKNGKFHGTVIDKGYTYEHKGQLFKIGGGIEFHENDEIESFYVIDKTETDFIVDGKKLILYRNDQVFFHEKSGLPIKIIMNLPRGAFLPLITNPNEDYNVFEISETGEIVNKIMENVRIMTLINVWLDFSDCHPTTKRTRNDFRHRI